MTPGWELGGRHPGVEEGAWLVECVGGRGRKERWPQACCAAGWHPRGEVVMLQHNYSRSPVSCASGTINSTYPQQTGTCTEDIRKMNSFSPPFRILLLITVRFSVGKCSCKASEQSAA